MSLRAWWEGGPAPFPTAAMEKWTARPWFRPAELSREGTPALQVAAPGETLLLGVRDGEGDLHLLAWDAPGGALPLSAEAAAALRAAQARSSWYAPLLLREGQKPAQPSARCLPTREPKPARLDGSSYGLAFALALASLASHTPLPPDLVATACLAANDRLTAVQGLEAKLQAVRDWAPGVRRVLVAAEQRDEAVEIGARFGLEILPVATLGEAADLALPSNDERVLEALERHEDPVHAFMALERVILHAAGGARIPPWKKFAETFAALSKALPDDLVPRAEFAKRVADRHDGGEAVQLPWTPRSAWPHRLVWLARVRHVVQAATDDARDDTLTARYADDAWKEVRGGGERDLEELRLAGAIGRAWAALGRLDEAAMLLDQVSAEWLAIDLPDEGSFSLTELLRIRALQGDAALAIERARAWLALPATSAVPRAFVSTALARALIVRAGSSRADASEALHMLGTAHLDPHDFPETHHLAPIRGRWRARALERLREDSRFERERLPQTGRPAVYRVLAELDHALATGADPARWVAALHPRERARLDRFCPEDRNPNAWYADAWRY